jgi:hypothetical protein
VPGTAMEGVTHEAGHDKERRQSDSRQQGGAGATARGLRAALRLLSRASEPRAVVSAEDRRYICNDACARLFAVQGQPPRLGAAAPGLELDLGGPIFGRVVDDVLQQGVPSVVKDHFICVVRDGRAEET